MIETHDLILKSGSPEDWPDLYKNLWNHEKAFSFLFTSSCPSEEAAKKKTAAYSQMHQQVDTEFFVFEKISMQCIGIAGIKPLSDAQFTVTDIAIGPAFQGKGYGKQILNALKYLAFQDRNASCLHYSCFDGNTASERLALSCGFSYTHSTEAELRKNGEPVILKFFQCTHL